MKPDRMEVKTENIPKELIEKNQWIVWRWELRDGKWTKPPYNPNSGEFAKSTDPNTWVSFNEALEALYDGGDWDGLGFMLTSPYCGIDWDDSVIPGTGDLHSRILSDLKGINSYSEYSPSGKGIKTLCKATLPKGGHHSNGIGIFQRDRYFCVTGHTLPGVSQKIEDRQEEIESFCKKHWPNDFETKEQNFNFAKIDTSPQPWQSVQREISKHPSIMLHWMTPKPEDRSGHDWRLTCLCVEEGCTDPVMLRQIISHNPHGKAASHPNTRKYIEDLISRCFNQSKVEISSKISFPVNSIKGLAGEFADLYSTYLESPWTFFAFNFLTCLGSLISDRITLASEISPQPRFYTVNLGESADDRKSESIKKTIQFFDSALAQSEFKICHGVGSAEGLARKLGEVEHGPKKLLLVYDELKSFVGKAMIEGATLLPAVNTFFESNKFHSATKTHSIELNDVFLSLLGASTLETFSRMWTPAFLDIGFLNRLWLVKDHSERRFSIPKEIPSSEINILHRKLGDLLKKFPEPLKLPINESARTIFDQWYFNVEPSPFTKRLDTYGLRLMILLTVNEGKSEVTEETTLKVIDLLQWQLKIRREVDPIDAEGSIAKVEQMIRRSLANGPLHKRDLQRKVNYQRMGIFIWGSAIRNLQSTKEVFYDLKTGIYRKGEI
jgi:hypothetical protein